MQRISITNPQNIIDGTAKKYYFKLRNTGGPKGDKGDKGDTGATGPQGAKGDPCTVIVNSTATLEPGSNAYVTNTGSLSNAVLNFGIPKGDRGPQGTKGDKGDTGAQGETGPRGPQGERGTNATVYIGTTSTLNPGSQATVYNSGTDSNAVLNFGIPQGAKGDTGSQGPQGPTGPAGQNFAATVVTELPETGDSSKLYLTPKAHTTQTATGNPITATVAEDAGSLESFQLDGDTFQQSYTGKNLFDKDNMDIRNGYLYSTTFSYRTSNADRTFIVPCEPSTTYTISRSVITSSFRAAYIDLEPSGIPADTSSETSLTCAGYIANNSGTSITITTSATAKSLLVHYGNTNTDGVTLIGQSVATIMVEKSASATSFEPYVGGQPSPNPDYPQPIQTVTGLQTVEIIGKNLFDIDSIITGYELISTTGEVRQNVDWWVTPLIPVKASAVYTSSNMRVSNKVFYAADGSFISTISTQTATAPAGARYMRMNAKLTDIPSYTGKAQLELGSTATAYAPYSKQTLPIDLGTIELCKLGTYQDYIYKDGDSWKVHKATKKLILDGSEEWLYYNGVCQLNSITDYAISNNTPYCGAFSGNSNVAGLSAVPENSCCFIRVSGETTPRFYVRYESKFSSVDAISQYLTTNPTSLYYALATATDTTITDTALIAQLEAIRTASLENGANTISNTATGSNLAGDMEIGYYGYNPTNRYDKWLWLDLNNNYEQIGS